MYGGLDSRVSDAPPLPNQSNQTKPTYNLSIIEGAYYAGHSLAATPLRRRLPPPPLVCQARKGGYAIIVATFEGQRQESR